MGKTLGRGHSTERLKALAVEKLSTKPGMYCDGGGLWLRVTTPTARSWVYRYMLNKQPREMGLGKYPEITLAEARTRAGEARKLKALGKDPLAERAAAQAAQIANAAKTVTFKEAAERYIEAHRAGWRNEKHVAQWSNTLAAYAYPIIGPLSVDQVDTGLVMKILEPIWTQKTETASRLRGRIETILDWAKVRGYRDGENPARWRGHLDKLLPAKGKVKKEEHHPALPFDALAAFMQVLRAENGTAARALEFCILTATRTGEVIGARWNEINLADKVWSIPGARMKAGRERRVPLSDRAIAILEALKPEAAEETAGEGFVFTSIGSAKALSSMAMLMLLRRMKRADLTIHGFRSTFRDWAAERTNFPRDVAEMALAHTIGDKVEAAYRRGELFEKRRQMMAAWATVCTLPPTGATVLPLQKAGTA